MINTTYLESTDVPASRSAEEIRESLVRAGARQIACEYGDAGQITGLKWAMRVGRSEIHFALPARVEPVYKLLWDNARGKPDKAKIRAKAERVAWRQLLAWVKIQNAMVQTGMVQAQEVYMPYAVAPGSSQTMFQAWAAQLALPAPTDK